MLANRLAFMSLLIIWISCGESFSVLLPKSGQLAHMRLMGSKGAAAIPTSSIKNVQIQLPSATDALSKAVGRGLMSVSPFAKLYGALSPLTKGTLTTLFSAELLLFLLFRLSYKRLLRFSHKVQTLLWKALKREGPKSYEKSILGFVSKRCALLSQLLAFHYLMTVGIALLTALGFRVRSDFPGLASSIALTLFLASFADLFKMHFLADFLPQVAENRRQMYMVNKSSSVVIWTLCVLVVCEMVSTFLKIPLSSTLAFGGLGGIAVGLSVRDAAANFMGGMLLLLNEPFTPGDMVTFRMDGQELMGRVERVGWSQTRIRGRDTRPIYVPNSHFVQTAVTNMDRLTHRKFENFFPIRFQDHARLEAVVARIKERLGKMNKLDQLSQPFRISFMDVGAYSLNIRVWVYFATKSLDEFLELQQAANMEVIKAVYESGAELAVPATLLHMNQPLPSAQASLSSAPPAVDPHNGTVNSKPPKGQLGIGSEGALIINGMGAGVVATGAGLGVISPAINGVDVEVEGGLGLSWRPETERQGLGVDIEPSEADHSKAIPKPGAAFSGESRAGNAGDVERRTEEEREVREALLHSDLQLLDQGGEGKEREELGEARSFREGQRNLDGDREAGQGEDDEDDEEDDLPLVPALRTRPIAPLVPAFRSMPQSAATAASAKANCGQQVPAAGSSLSQGDHAVEAAQVTETDVKVGNTREGQLRDADISLSISCTGEIQQQEQQQEQQEQQDGFAPTVAPTRRNGVPDLVTQGMFTATENNASIAYDDTSASTLRGLASTPTSSTIPINSDADERASESDQSLYVQSTTQRSNAGNALSEGSTNSEVEEAYFAAALEDESSLLELEEAEDPELVSNNMFAAAAAEDSSVSRLADLEVEALSVTTVEADKGMGGEFLTNSDATGSYRSNRPYRGVVGVGPADSRDLVQRRFSMHVNTFGSSGATSAPVAPSWIPAFPSLPTRADGNTRSSSAASHSTVVNAFHHFSSASSVGSHRTAATPAAAGDVIESEKECEGESNMWLDSIRSAGIKADSYKYITLQPMLQDRPSPSSAEDSPPQPQHAVEEADHIAHSAPQISQQQQHDSATGNPFAATPGLESDSPLEGS